MKYLFQALFLFCITVCSCKDPFTPELNTLAQNLLVVEGYLNIGGETVIHLSRTTNLKEWRVRIPEKDATVQVFDNQKEVANGISVENGKCVLQTNHLDIRNKYFVRITTSGGKIYRSSLLTPVATPEIDSIVYKPEGNGFQLYLNAHDSSNTTRFYSWSFQETWEFRSPVLSTLEYKNGKVVDRDQSVNITRCWQENSSSSILINSTERLSEDRVETPLTFINGNSIKLSQLYSILVKQYGLSREAYAFLETMKKNTEDIGTLFDPQPTELKGNIMCESDPDELVVGWISAGKIVEKRLFINNAERLASWSYRMEGCDAFRVRGDSIGYYTQADYLIYSTTPVGYIVARSRCIDCRLSGSNIKPAYWPN